MGLGPDQCLRRSVYAGHSRQFGGGFEVARMRTPQGPLAGGEEQDEFDLRSPRCLKYSQFTEGLSVILEGVQDH